jgi:hypothetical protein
VRLYAQTVRHQKPARSVGPRDGWNIPTATTRRRDAPMAPANASAGARRRDVKTTRDDGDDDARGATREGDAVTREAARRRAEKAKAQSANERAGVAAILVFIVLRLVQRWYAASEARYLSTTDEQPLVETREDFLDFKRYGDLKACALKHPKLRVKGGLNDGGFSKTRGFVVKFNLEGEKQFKASPDYECFASLFDELRLPAANAFVMNILLCELGDYDAYSADELSVGLHLDTTVGIYSRHMFVAHQVSVLYNSVPNDMVGGELELFPYGDGYPDTGAAPEAKIRPKENMLVNFRGDAFHQVRSYKTRSGSERVSLVLEQYIIDDDAYGKTMRFFEAFKSNMTMM